jgi:hypothetical protein
MKGADTKVANMNELQSRLRYARKVCADDGYNGRFCQVFNDAIDSIAELEQQRDELLAVMNNALLAWVLDHLSHDPIDLLVEAIDKHNAQGVQHE